MQFCPSPQGGAQRFHLRFITVAFTQMGGGHFFWSHEPTICPFDHYSDGTTTGPPPHTPARPPRSHKPTICPFDHYSDGTITGPLRTPASHLGPAPPGPTNPLFVHLTIIVTERPWDPADPRLTPRPRPPRSHEPTICPFDHYSDGTTMGPLRTNPPTPPPGPTKPLFVHLNIVLTERPQDPRGPTPHPPHPQVPRTHYLSI